MKFKKIIFFQAHPDDLEFSCPHLIYYLSKMSKNTYEIRIASLTRGEFGTAKHGSDHFKGERLGKLRTNELYRAHRIYGIMPKQIHFFEIMDGSVKFDKITMELVKKYLEKEKPDIVVACEPIYTFYFHPDHMNIGKILFYIFYNKLLSFHTSKLYFYSTIKSNFWWPFAKKDVPFALKLLKEHKSQYYMNKNTAPIYKIMSRIYGRHLKGWKYAEGYRRQYFGKYAYKNEKLGLLKRSFSSFIFKTWRSIAGNPLSVIKNDKELVH